MAVLESQDEVAGVCPDGRPLHAYGVEEAQYDRLEVEVRQKLSGRRFVSAAAPFVLWAAERYRRTYDGGSLSWDFLTRPLELSLSQEELREITREGLYQLGRSVRHTGGGTQYLRTIAAEGGIPLRLLSEQGGVYRAALVGLVADLSRIGLGCPRDVALGFAVKRTRRLPIGYRTNEFQELFVTFAFEVLELRALAPEGIASHEVEPFLDRVKPEWRDGLSLRLDGDAARSLLSEAVLVTARHGLVTDPFTRVLRRRDDDIWVPWMEIEEAAEIAPQLIQGVDPERRMLRLAPVGTLASAAPDLLFALDRESAERPWNTRRISGRRTGRFRFPLDTAAELMAMADGNFLGRVRLAGGEPFEMGVGPTFWRLAEMGEDAAQALAYAGNASLRTRDPHLWMLIESGRTPECSGTLEANPDGSVDGGVLWRLSGKGRVLVRGGNARIETGADDDDRDEILACGSLNYRVLDGRNAPVHCGIPSILYRHAGRGFRQLIGKELRHRLNGSLGWRAGAPPDLTIGRIAFAVREGDGVGARISANVVPSKFRVRDVTYAEDAHRTVRFEGVPPEWVLRVAGGPPLQADCDGLIETSLDGTSGQRGRLPLVIAGPDGMPPLNWALDLPLARGEFQTVEGDTLAENRDISMQDLKTWRIVPAEGHRTDLQIRLHGVLTVDAPIVGRRITAEQPMSAFRPLLEEMLVTGGPDAELRLRVVTDGDHSARLRLRHVLGETQLVGEDVLVLRDQVPMHDPALAITAVNLDDPSCVVDTGARGLSHLGEGRWFLLPSKDGVPMRPPRPLVLPEPQTIEGANAPRRPDRISHFAEHLRNRTADGDLSRLAKLAGLLIEKGISPSALDEIHALAKVPSVAVRLLMRVGTPDLEDALSLELHGGPRWAFIHPDTWAKGFEDEAQLLREKFSDLPTLADKADDLVRETLTARAADILRLRPALEGHVALALLRLDPAALGDLASKLGGLSPGLQKPEDILLKVARQVVSRNATSAPQLHILAAHRRPSGFEAFHPDLQGLVDAPIVVAEIAFGLRASPPTRQKLELMQAVQADPAGYEAALPAAISWLANPRP